MDNQGEAMAQFKQVTNEKDVEDFDAPQSPLFERLCQDFVQKEDVSGILRYSWNGQGLFFAAQRNGSGTEIFGNFLKRMIRSKCHLGNLTFQAFER